MIKNYLLLMTFLSSVRVLHAQNIDSIMQQDAVASSKNEAVTSFKSNRLILSETTTMVDKYDLDFKVIHRFGDIAGPDGGSRTLYGFDNSTDISINFEYGITDHLNAGFSRNKYEQLLEFQLKYAILKQKQANGPPISIGLIAKTAFTPYKVNTSVFDKYSNRFSYFFQGIFSRKFSPDFSLQWSPGILVRNVLLGPGDERILFSSGAAARYKLTKRFAIVADYYLIGSKFRKENPNADYYNPLGLGIEIETGGHVFTLNFCNAKAISEINFLANSTSSWTKGQYRFGFSISRMFTLHRSTTENKS